MDASRQTISQTCANQEESNQRETSLVDLNNILTNQSNAELADKKEGDLLQEMEPFIKIENRSNEKFIEEGSDGELLNQQICLEEDNDDKESYHELKMLSGLQLEGEFVSLDHVEVPEVKPGKRPGTNKRHSTRTLSDLQGKAHEDTRKYLEESYRSELKRINSGECNNHPDMLKRVDQDKLKSQNKVNKRQRDGVPRIHKAKELIDDMVTLVKRRRVVGNKTPETKDHLTEDNQSKTVNKRFIPIHNFMSKANDGTRGLGFPKKRPKQRKPKNLMMKSDEQISSPELIMKDVVNLNEMIGRTYKVNKLNDSYVSICEQEEYTQMRLLGKRGNMADEEQIYFCPTHQHMKIEFLCEKEDCLRELCSKCILEHKSHINHVKHLNDLIKEQFERVEGLDLSTLENEINSGEEKESRKLKDYYEMLNKKLLNGMNLRRGELVLKNNRGRKVLNDMRQFQEQFSIFHNNPRILELASFTSKDCVDLLKSCMTSKEHFQPNTFTIETTASTFQCDRILRDNLSFPSRGLDMNTVSPNKPKYLHWFEWGERVLHLYDIVKNNFRSLKLVNNVKIPNFSRSIMTPDAKIFLLGGEDPGGNARQEVHMFDVDSASDHYVLQPKDPMPHKKYDFALCYLDGDIFVIGGKDSSTGAVDLCEK